MTFSWRANVFHEYFNPADFFLEFELEGSSPFLRHQAEFMEAIKKKPDLSIDSPALLCNLNLLH